MYLRYTSITIVPGSKATGKKSSSLKISCCMVTNNIAKLIPPPPFLSYHISYGKKYFAYFHTHTHTTVTPPRVTQLTPTHSQTDSAVRTSRMYHSTLSLTRTDSGSSVLGGEAERARKIQEEVSRIEKVGHQCPCELLSSSGKSISLNILLTKRHSI